MDSVPIIRCAKEPGFSLEEIGDLLTLRNDRLHGVEGIEQRASKRLHELDRRIAQLTEMRDALAVLVEECPGSGEPEGCPILGDIRRAAAPAP
ncbi:MerR family DNA-binding protein [Xanthomonas theicola]|nr:MerR family DNA-binding protein [Xanthomonas theicola]